MWARFSTSPSVPSSRTLCTNILCLPQVTNATLKVVTGLTKLESLTLGFTRVLNAGVAHLSRMTALTELHFFAEDVSDVALQVEWPALSCFQRLCLCRASTGTSHAAALLEPASDSWMTCQCAALWC